MNSLISNYNYLFYKCENLDSPNMNFQVVSPNVKYMDYMFYGAGLEGTTTFDNQNVKFCKLVSCKDSFKEAKFGFRGTVFQFYGSVDTYEQSLAASVSSTAIGKVLAEDVISTVVVSSGSTALVDGVVLTQTFIEKILDKNIDSITVYKYDEGTSVIGTEKISVTVDAIGRKTSENIKKGNSIIVPSNTVITENSVNTLKSRSIEEITVYSIETADVSVEGLDGKTIAKDITEDTAIASRLDVLDALSIYSIIGSGRTAITVFNETERAVGEDIIGRMIVRDIYDGSSVLLVEKDTIVSQDTVDILKNGGKSTVDTVDCVTTLNGLFSGNRWLASSAPTIILSNSTYSIEKILANLKKITDGGWLPDGDAFCGGSESYEIYPSGIIDFSNLYSNTSIKHVNLKGLSCCMSEDNVGSSCYHGRITYESMFENCTELKKIDGHIPQFGYTYRSMFKNCTSLEIDLAKSFVHYVKEKDAHRPEIVLSAQYSQNWWWWYGGWRWNTNWWGGYYYPYYYNYGYYNYWNYNYGYYGWYNGYYSLNHYYYDGWYNGYYYNYYNYYHSWYGGWYPYPAYYNAWHGYYPYYNGWYGWGNWWRGGWTRSWWRYGWYDYRYTPYRRYIPYGRNWCAIRDDLVGRIVAERIHIHDNVWFDVGRRLTAVDIALMRTHGIPNIRLNWLDDNMQGWGIDDSEILNGYNSITCKNTAFNNMDTLMFKVQGNFKLSFYWKAKIPYKNGLIYLIDDTIDYPYAESIKTDNTGIKGMTLKNAVQYRPRLFGEGHTISSDDIKIMQQYKIRTVKVYSSGSSGSTLWKNVEDSENYVTAAAVYSATNVILFNKEHVILDDDYTFISNFNQQIVNDITAGYSVPSQITYVYVHDTERYRIRARKVISSREYADKWENVQYSTNDILTPTEDQDGRWHLIRILTHDCIGGGRPFNNREWCFSNITLELENGRIVEAKDFEEYNPSEYASATRQDLVGKWLSEDVVIGTQNTIAANHRITTSDFDSILKYRGTQISIEIPTSSEDDGYGIDMVLSQDVYDGSTKVLSKNTTLTHNNIATIRSHSITSVSVYAENPLRYDILRSNDKLLSSGYTIKRSDYGRLVGKSLTTPLIVNSKTESGETIEVFSKGERITFRNFSRIDGYVVTDDVYGGNVLISRGTKLTEGYRKTLVGRSFGHEIVTGRVIVYASDITDRPLNAWDVAKIQRSGVQQVKIQDYGETPSGNHVGEYLLCEEDDSPMPVHSFEEAYYRTTSLNGYEPSSIAYMFDNVKKLYSSKDEFDLAVLVKKTNDTLENNGISISKKYFTHAFPPLVIAMEKPIDGLTQVNYDITDISSKLGILRYCSFSNSDDNTQYGLGSKFMKWVFPNGFVRYGGILQSNPSYYILVPYYPIKNSSGELTDLRPFTSTKETKLTPVGYTRLFNVTAHYKNHDEWVAGRTNPWNVLTAATSECKNHRAYNWVDKSSLLYAALVYDKTGKFIGKRYLGTWSEGIYSFGYHPACNGSYKVTSSRIHPLTIFEGTVTTEIPDVGSVIYSDSGKIDSRNAVSKTWYETLQK